VEEVVLVRSRRHAAGDDTYRAVVTAVARRLRDMPEVEQVGKPQVSGDGHAVLVPMTLAGPPRAAYGHVDEVQAVTAQLQRRLPGFELRQVGDASADIAIDESVDRDFARAERSSVPITLLILLVTFGSVVAAGVPLLLALSSVAATLGVLDVLSQAWPMDDAVSSVVLLVGLAVGVDYSLFYLRREREERAAGRDAAAALQAAAATSGRAVLVSGVTVIIAMGGLYLTGIATFTAIATGTILVVAVALAASTTVLPAVLATLGDRVERGRLPFRRRSRSRGHGRRQGRLLGAILDRVLRRPAVAAAVAGGLLVALSVPALGMKTALPGTGSLPRDLDVVQTYKAIQAAFPGRTEPAVVAVQAADVTAPAVRAQIAALGRRAGGVIATDVTADHRVARVVVPLAGTGTDRRSRAALAALRERHLPATLGRLPGVRVAVTGTTADSADFDAMLNARLPLVFAFVGGLAFLLLLVTFRSLVVPLKAIVLNLLSVGAAYGVLTLVFGHGWLESALGFDSTGTVVSWLPLFLFVILFGLSMDYHVFILSRVRELVDAGMSTDAAVGAAVRQTAGVVTSAAMIMVAVFAVFATLGSMEYKQMGVGLAVAIFVDATIVRAVLLPASMKLLGEWNWYLPRSLGWLPRIAREAAVA
ncbi:MAG TPA: MMPL family transporter, partial [Solirubrobacteraceae bacterium]